MAYPELKIAQIDGNHYAVARPDERLVCVTCDKSEALLVACDFLYGRDFPPFMVTPEQELAKARRFSVQKQYEYTRQFLAEWFPEIFQEGENNG